MMREKVLKYLPRAKNAPEKTPRVFSMLCRKKNQSDKSKLWRSGAKSVSASTQVGKCSFSAQLSRLKTAAQRELPLTDFSFGCRHSFIMAGRSIPLHSPPFHSHHSAQKKKAHARNYPFPSNNRHQAHPASPPSLPDTPPYPQWCKPSTPTSCQKPGNHHDASSSHQ